MSSPRPIYIFALSSLGDGISGGDRIYIELARRWSKKQQIKLYVWEEGLAMCQRQNLYGKFLDITLVPVGVISKIGFVFTYFYRILLGIKLALTLKIEKNAIIFSASEFWMDSIPAMILKIRQPSISWVAAWYQTAPNPFVGFSEGQRNNRYLFSAWLYWFVQLPIKPIISRFATFVLVNNESEKTQFNFLTKKNRSIVLYGAVDLDIIKKYLEKNNNQKKYDAVFQGRFHPQKGVVELMDIWALVVDKIPEAKLILIGDGPLMNEVRTRIRVLGLSKNVSLRGYVYDGNTKYKIFSQSRLVLHPSYYDSGGMASAEAMAFGIPGVSYDLKSYISYYPKGLVKCTIGDKRKFSDNVIKLLSNSVLRNKIGTEAKKMIYKNWSWDNRATEILNLISK